MASKLNIANLSFNHLAMKSITQAELDANLTPSAKAFNAYFKFCRDDLFREHKWPFANIEKILTMINSAWNSSTVYTLGQYVEFENILYIAILAGTNQQPDTQTTYWTAVSHAPLQFAFYYLHPTSYNIEDLDLWQNGIDVDARSAWSSGTSYSVGDLIKYNDIAYISIQAGSNKQPDTQTAYWTAQTSAYAIGDAIYYNNVAYLAILAGTNKNPATETTYWTAQTNIATVWCVFNEATADKKDEQDFEIRLIPGATDIKVIGSNLAEAYMEYTFIVNNITLWDAKFVMAMSYRMAASMAHQLTGDAQKGLSLMNVSNAYIAETKRTSASEKKKKPTQTSAYQQSR